MSLARIGRKMRRILGGALGAMIVAGTLAAAEGTAAAPVLVSKAGGAGAKWTDLAALRKAAGAGEPEAVMELGLMHEFGREVAEDAAKARALYAQAAAGGVVEADFRLGRLLSEGLGGPADLGRAYAHYHKAARAGHALAQYNVGAMLASARGVRRDYVEGLAWIILASRHEEVDRTGERKLRERLARRPRDIAAAEVRAIALAQELAAAKEKTARVASEAPARPGVDVPAAVPAAPMQSWVPPPLVAPRPTLSLPGAPPKDG